MSSYNVSRRALIGGLGAAAGLSHARVALAADEPIRIGVLATLTGPGGVWGLAVDGAARVAADEVNRAGGLRVGATTHLLEVVSYDDQYKAANAVTAVNRLIDRDGVRFILGPIASVSVSAIKPITEDKKVFLFPNSWSASTLKDTNYVFRVAATTREFAPAAVAWLKANRPMITAVATLAPNDETGWNSQAVQKEVYAKAGYRVVATELFERSQTDFRAIVAKLLAASPDSIELDTVPPSTAGLIVRQARDAGFKGAFTKFGGFDVNEIVRTAGSENAEGIVGVLNADPGSEAWARLRTEYARFQKNEMGDFVFLFYDAARILLAGIAKAGTASDPDAIRTAIEQLAPFPGTVGGLNWGGAADYGVNHQLYTPVFLTEIAGGKGRVIGKIDLV